jgi:REP element-mobilizing transposase RayT
MTAARQTQVCLRDTPYYHCIARCVRRAWLWGKDEYAGKDYSHRKAWVIDRLRHLSRIFAVEVCAYAVMSNHYHVVLYVDMNRALAWNDKAVIRRWNRLFRLPTLIDRYRRGEPMSLAEQDAVKEVLREWRQRLMDVSWFMRCLNEYLARRANNEDGCTGRFWEGRFKSQALLDDAGLLTAMAYVDLNPVRARVSSSLEKSEFTSICERIRFLATGRPNTFRLRRFRSPMTASLSLPCSWDDYLQLVQWTGRAIRNGKAGYLDVPTPPLLRQLNIDAVAWQAMMSLEGNLFGRAVGQLDHLRLHARALGQKWTRGLRLAERMYGAV